MLMLLIALHGEDLAAALRDGEVARFGRLQDLAELVREGVAIRKRVEKGAGGGVLCVGPLLYRRVVEVFQPAVIVGIGDRLLGSLRQQRADRNSQKESASQHAANVPKWGRPPGLSGWACSPPIVMKTPRWGRPSACGGLSGRPDGLSITYSGVSTGRGSSRPRSSCRGIPEQAGVGRPQGWSPAPRILDIATGIRHTSIDRRWESRTHPKFCQERWIC